MACVDKLPPNNVESEMEEGEIIDELDDLSDISSEEEFLMRQRLEVLENYNNVLERTKAKRSSVGTGTKKRDVVYHVSAIRTNDKNLIAYKHNIKVQKYVKPSKQKRRKGIEHNVDENNIKKKKDHRKKNVYSKKQLVPKVVNETSDESEDEYRNKRKKLADAVSVHRINSDKSSLSARLFKMMHGSELHGESLEQREISSFSSSHEIILNKDQFSPISSMNTEIVDERDHPLKLQTNTVCEPIELSTDDDIKIIEDVVQDNRKNVQRDKCNENETNEFQISLEKDSDDDLELLRKHALESKPAKTKTDEPDHTENNKLLSDDEDSDTAELRLICLKSALLKKAIEMKQKQKLQKRLSTSQLENDLFSDKELLTTKEDSDNNTDIESVDMDMGSDIEDKLKDCNGDSDSNLNKTGLNLRLDDSSKNNLINCAIDNLNASSKEDELDEDEDLLRAKLLTSLSKNLTNLVSPEILNKIDEVKNVSDSVQVNSAPANLPEDKARFIIQVNESDSEGEHEATKNLTKMHMKLAEQIDFQQKLDLFLKSTRNQVEKKDKLPDVVQKSPVLKKPDKFVAKTVKHLPKSEQIEYKNLVRRMAELEKMKQSRQAMINLVNQPLPVNDTLKPRNVTIDAQAEINNNLEELIAKSRKRIAEESAKMLKLKEEATKLSQRYKIAATELRNITTAIALNKKQQRTIQNSLGKIRLQHQSLLKNSTPSLHSKVNGRVPYLSNISNKVTINRLQKENNPKEDYNNPNIQKTVKVSVVNDFVSEEQIAAPKLSVEVDIANNTKVVKVPNSPKKDRVVEINDEKEQEENSEQLVLLGDKDSTEIEKANDANDAELVAVCDHGNKRYYISVDDYRSPLDALGTTNWKEDPNAILCPFEVRGQCKDRDCKYLHTTPTVQ